MAEFEKIQQIKIKNDEEIAKIIIEHQKNQKIIIDAIMSGKANGNLALVRSIEEYNKKFYSDILNVKFSESMIKEVSDKIEQFEEEISQSQQGKNNYVLKA